PLHPTGGGYQGGPTRGQEPRDFVADSFWKDPDSSYRGIPEGEAGAEEGGLPRAPESPRIGEVFRVQGDGVPRNQDCYLHRRLRLEWGVSREGRYDRRHDCEVGFVYAA